MTDQSLLSPTDDDVQSLIQRAVRAFEHADELRKRGLAREWAHRPPGNLDPLLHVDAKNGNLQIKFPDPPTSLAPLSTRTHTFATRVIPIKVPVPKVYDPQEELAEAQQFFAALDRAASEPLRAIDNFLHQNTLAAYTAATTELGGDDRLTDSFDERVASDLVVDKLAIADDDWVPMEYAGALFDDQPALSLALREPVENENAQAVVARGLFLQERRGLGKRPVLTALPWYLMPRPDLRFSEVYPLVRELLRTYLIAQAPVVAKQPSAVAFVDDFLRLNGQAIHDKVCEWIDDERLAYYFFDNWLVVNHLELIVPLLIFALAACMAQRRPERRATLPCTSHPDSPCCVIEIAPTHDGSYAQRMDYVCVHQLCFDYELRFMRTMQASGAPSQCAQSLLPPEAFSFSLAEVAFHYRAQPIQLRDLLPAEEFLYWHMLQQVPNFDMWLAALRQLRDTAAMPPPPVAGKRPNPRRHPFST